MPADLAGHHRRPPARLAGLRGGAGRDPDPPRWSRPNPDSTRPGPRRQGLLQSGDPLPPAPTRDPGHHSRTRRPAGSPPTTGQRRRAATAIRRRELQAAQHRRAVHQQAEGLPGGGHPLRQTRPHLPRQHRCRLDQNLAARPRPMIQGTGPSRQPHAPGRRPARPVAHRAGGAGPAVAHRGRCSCGTWPRR